MYSTLQYSTCTYASLGLSSELVEGITEEGGRVPQPL